MSASPTEPSDYDSPMPEAIECPQYLGDAHRTLSEKAEDPAPHDVTYSVTPSRDFGGRVAVAFSWLNDVDIYRATVAISEFYGYPNTGDDFIAHAQPSAAAGECWNWYSSIPRMAAQPNSVHTTIDGLWPNQKYCFFAAYQASGEIEWSVPTDIVCFTTTWKSNWGSPEYPG